MIAAHVALSRIWRAWCAETCAGEFDPNHPGRGQCAVTALLVQDLLGGELLRAVVDGQSHYWNLIPGMGEIDLTREQFSRNTDIPRGEFVRPSRLLDGERAIAARTQERYQLLKSRFERGRP